ncbi:MAG TPA: NADH-quinone oxidoreductase subunit L [Dehalococcoidia bacterium]|nr:NADH-quinone oxidoreductase subunit L [Dehalococcoidia bacterium]
MLATIPEAALWAIWLLPLASFATIVLYTYERHRLCGYVTVAAILGSLLLSLWALDSSLQADGHPLSLTDHSWLTIGPLEVKLGLALDGLAAVMVVVVSSVSLLVQFYSQAYMHGDTGYPRYFAYMSLFTASMLGLVLADNLLMLYVFWEGVGVCSYLLIGFWFHKPEAARAAMKAFIVTRLGDLGFLIGLVYMWTQAGSFDIEEIRDLALAGALSATAVMWFAGAVFAGAVGKSAQFPLHVWLPDAMEGPTPVSALIHAATMVAAGVYLVARLFPIFDAVPEVSTTVAIIGGLSAIMAATMGLVVTDIKRVMAYSTISQLGYMMLALGVGGYGAAIFHLFNHAFFKALLFLGAGSVNHATGTFDMRRMGGLARAMPITATTVVIAALSLSGIPPFSGFFSKDEVLLAAWHEKRLLYWLGLVTAFLTALYAFRMVFLTFGGRYRGGEASGHGAHAGPHESPWVMLLPMAILAALAVGSGFANRGSGFVDLLRGALPPELAEHEEPAFDTALAVRAVLAAALGIALAWLIYGVRVLEADALRRLWGPIHRLVENKYYMDEIYEQGIVGRVLYRGIVGLLALFDGRAVDGAVNGIGFLTRQGGQRLRQLQTGQLQAYGLAIFAGAVAIMAGILIARP